MGQERSANPVMRDARGPETVRRGADYPDPHPDYRLRPAAHQVASEGDDGLAEGLHASYV